MAVTEDLIERVAVVTGGGSGVGESLCRRLAGRGASVYVADVDVDASDRVAADIGGDPLDLDVSDRSAWDEALGRVVGEKGALDFLALNAGVMTRPKGEPMDDDPLPWMADRYDRIRAVNIDGVVYGVMAALPYMTAAADGHIVATASVAGLMPQEPDPAYSMTKHAVIGLVRSLAGPLGARGISIGAVCPGGVDTSLVPPDIRALGRGFASPDFVAGALEAVLELPVEQNGGIWISYGTEQPMWRYEFAPVREGPPA